jgi:Uma2 family endonuclease
MGIATLESYGLDELEELQQQHPEFGRVEIINGSLIAGGVDVTGDRHQSVVQALFLLLIEQCPSEQVIRLDTYWFGDQVRLRPDVAIWPTPDRPADGGAFVTPPLAVIEVLSTDADHDLVRKYEIYRSFGVVSWFVDPAQRNGWWLSDGDAFRFDGESATVELPGRPPIEVPRSLLSA